MRLKNYWKAISGENTKQVLFATIPLAFFGLWSIRLFLDGEDDWFSRLGSLIVAWALVNLAVRREKYSQHLWKTERGRIISILNSQTKAQDMLQESLSRTFNLHASQIAQLNHSHGQDNPFVENTPEAIQKFCRDVENEIKEPANANVSEILISEASKREKTYQEELWRYTGWGKLLWRLEVLLILWGTIQWGYGDLLVKWWHLS